jgi:Fur family ferric uptake transcriptional regulator
MAEYPGRVRPSTETSQPIGAAMLPGGRQRSTRQGEAVDAALRASEGFRTAQDLYGEIRQRGDRIGLTTVYRHLKMLVDAGAVDVVHRADGEAQYRLCGSRDAAATAPAVDHHHHLVCRMCGRAVEVAGPQVERWAERVAAEHGYTDVSHTLEVFGLCPEHSAS